MTGNAVILCADSQEVVSGYTKTTIQKIRTTSFFNNRLIGVVGSGEDTTYIDAYYKDLQTKLGVPARSASPRRINHTSRVTRAEFVVRGPDAIDAFNRLADGRCHAEGQGIQLASQQC
jgi:hypothetical protein